MNIDEILNYMETVPGWFAREEGHLLYKVATDAVVKFAHGTIVEVGSYCGRSTTVLGCAVKNAQRGKVFAIDPHEGVVSGVTTSEFSGSAQTELFKRNMDALGLDVLVTLIKQKSTEVSWVSPIALIFIDGLHDMANVSADYKHFIDHVEKGGFVAFHDYGKWDYPDVSVLVDDLIAKGKLSKVAGTGSLLVTTKL